MAGKKTSVPVFENYMNPILKALFKMGGSGTNSEIYETVSDLMDLSETVLAVPHGKTGRNEVQYRIAWALTYLKKSGYINNSGRGVWSLINPKSLSVVDEQLIKKTVKQKDQKKKESSEKTRSTEKETDLFESENWKIEALSVLQSMPPQAFERLCQRLLREAGFTEVTVTGKSGDGGIDGHGILRLAGLVSFRVLFQSKRYQGTVSVGQLREFQAAVMGRADRGLFITTGSFTKDAKQEARRDGAPMIDLVDGDQLVDKLKEYSLGINTQMVEQIDIDKLWFDNI